MLKLTYEAAPNSEVHQIVKPCEHIKDMLIKLSVNNMHKLLDIFFFVYKCVLV